MTARLELLVDQKERIAWLKTMVELAMEWEGYSKLKQAFGAEATAYAKYFRLDEEIQLYNVEYGK